MENKRGFTLIELLVVISIIGILSSLVLVSLNDVRAKARNARRQSDIRQIALALELDYDDDEQYSRYADIDGLKKIPCSNPPDCSGAGDGKYLDPVPADPSSDKSYVWLDNTTAATTGCHSQSYCVYAELELDSGYVAGSEKGTKLLQTAPDTCPCI